MVKIICMEIKSLNFIFASFNFKKKKLSNIIDLNASKEGKKKKQIQFRYAKINEDNISFVKNRYYYANINRM